MRLFEYLEARYVHVNLLLQQNYTAALHAETLAIQSLINGNRTTLKWMAYPKLLFLFVLTKMRIVKRLPSPKEVAAKMQADQKALLAVAKADAAAIEAKALEETRAAEVEARSLLNEAASSMDIKDLGRANAIAEQLAKQRASVNNG
jgi:hypothetical protein